MSEQTMNSGTNQEMQDPIEMSPYEITEPYDFMQPVLNLQKERKFCSGIGMNYFIYFLIASGLQLGMQFAIMYGAMEIMVDHFGLFMILVMAPTYAIAFPILAALMKRCPAAKIEQHKISGGNFMILLMMCFGVMIIGNFMGILVNAVISLITGNPVINSVDLMMSNSSLWANILIVGICAPIFEELLFRKFLVSRMVRYGEAAAVVVSGLMFGLFHGNFSQFFYATFLGFFLAYVYVKTGKVKYSMFIHMIINMSSTLMVPVLAGLDTAKLTRIQVQFYVAGSSVEKLTRAMRDLMDVLPYLIILLVYEFVLYGMAIAGIVLFIMRRKRFTFAKGEVTLPKGERASVIWGNVGMILFTAGCLGLFVFTLVMS